MNSVEAASASNRRYSRKVKRPVCRMFIALSASRASITHEMLISLAPRHQVSLGDSLQIYVRKRFLP